MYLITPMPQKPVAVAVRLLFKRSGMYKMRYIGDPVLRRATDTITEFGKPLKKIIANMIETMHHQEGIGLAAPQVGISKKLILVDISGMEDEDADGPEAFVNPEILESFGEPVTLEEGCLSIPDVREDVTRPEGIRVRYQDENGKEYTKDYYGWMARVLQHEIDHINGVLFVDLISPLKQQMLIKTKQIPERY